jgi:hypothetical protein
MKKIGLLSKINAGVAVSAAMLLAGPAHADVLVNDQVLPLMEKIPTHDGWTLADFKRRNHLKILSALAGPAEPEENLRPTDYVIDVMFDRTENFDDFPCDLKHIAGGGYARYVKRGKKYLPDAPLAEYLTTGRCPTKD